MPVKKRDQKQLDKDTSSKLIENLQYQVKKLAEEKQVAVAMLQSQT
jgi:hypothetical protein